ncbi:MAG: hypothetical protein JSS75_05590 [Bacteroidetes bacterium]|nr:hypothetical protein [Bacteroidota bacterium]
MRQFITCSCIVIGLILWSTQSKAQGLLDGLRLSTSGTGTSARGLSMGGALVGAVNDWSALEYNPAALTLVEHNEFNVALYNRSYSSSADFLSTNSSDDITNTVPYSFAYAAPVPTDRGHLAFGLSVDRIADFTSTYRFSAVNPSSSYLNTSGFVNDPGYRSGLFSNYLSFLDSTNMAWALYLTRPLDSTQPKLTTPYSGGMLQSGTVTQEGGLNAFRIGAGVDVAENVSIGATVNVLFGSYDYRRTYSETDVNGVYNRPDSAPPYNLKSATITDVRSQSISGVSLKLALYTEPNEYLRFGLTFTTPTVYSIDDHFTRTGVASFTNGSTYRSSDWPNTEPSISNSYSITSPASVSVGGSFSHWGLTLAASASYTDYSQLHFSGDNVDLSDLNDAARSLLHGVLAWNVGGEYMINPIGVLLRGGFSSTPSAYKDDPSNYGTKTWSTGVGILLSKSTILELAYRHSSYTTDHSLYSDVTAGPNPTSVSASIDKDEISLSELAISFSFRF